MIWHDHGVNERLYNLEKRVTNLEPPLEPPVRAATLAAMAAKFDDAATREPSPLEKRVENIEHILKLLMQREGVQRVRVTEEIYQDLLTIITETREELRKVKPTGKA